MVTTRPVQWSDFRGEGEHVGWFGERCVDGLTNVFVAP